MKTKIKQFIEENKIVCSIIPPMAIALIVTSVIAGTSFWQLLPLLISLIVMLLQSAANRYAFLLGGLNSVIYAIVYISFTLYSSAASALLMSFPIQILTFINWNKRKYKQSTSFRHLTPKGSIILVLGTVAVYFLITPLFSLLGSSYMVIDNIVLAISLLSYALTLFSFVEYPYVQIIGVIINIVMNFTVLTADMSILPHAIYNFYALVCSVFTCINTRRLYREQQNLI